MLGRCSARIEDDRGVLRPFAVETAAFQDPAVRRTALVGRAGRRILVLEYYERRVNPDLASLRESLAWAGLDQVRVCTHLPVDKRHNAKIDYPALHKVLDQMERL